MNGEQAQEGSRPQTRTGKEKRAPTHSVGANLTAKVTKATAAQISICRAARRMEGMEEFVRELLAVVDPAGRLRVKDFFGIFEALSCERQHRGCG